MKLYEFSNVNLSEQELLKNIIDELNRLLMQKEKVNFYVSGGKSPKNLFNNLSKANIKWQNINVCLVDERIVPTDHIDSNTRLVSENLLINNAKNANFMQIIDIDRANKDYLKPDLMILGMGADAHTASIFPNASNLDELLNDTKTAYHIVKTSNYDRISLSMNAILSSKIIFLNISKDDKYEAFLKSSKEKNKAYPISFVLNSNVDVRVFYAKD